MLCVYQVLQFRERTFTNFNPSVIFQGRVVQRMGPLQAEPGTRPCFAQLYVLDSSLKTTTRFNNMNIPANTSQPVKNILEKLLQNVQQVMHDNNPFIRDFKQILEIPEEELHGGKVVISAGARPQQGHARVYNAQVNLQELSIVTNEQRHDVLLNLQWRRTSVNIRPQP